MNVALHLLCKYKDLFSEAFRDLEDSNSVLFALAKTPSIFPSDSRFGLREQLIYDSKFSNLSFIMHVILPQRYCLVEIIKQSLAAASKT
ncbi:hypothetical protein MtrunA17_Chr5g0410421 [Medicago truncatula]|uniref:Uncharacterized protein n=1 Tax=Medicago truncatula TaxID=3880 RepID=A0A396HVP3_MEDTR|nr:hypothetical protein MtrunA17_Chr5g0410421 [Medicago truncatula]